VGFGGRVWAVWAVVAVCVAAGPAAAQYPGQVTDKDKNAASMRSVAVLEYTGDMTHPTASRLVPISLYDGEQIQDAGIYLARPQPLALDPETEYELQKDGKNIGFFDLSEAVNQQDSWIGEGSFKALPKAPTAAELAEAAAKQKVDMDDADSDTPVLHRKHHDDEQSGGSGSSAADPDRPTLHKSGDSGSDSGSSNAPAPDPDRPRLHADDDSAKSKDSDQPKAQKNPDNEVASVESLPNVSDPDRPRLMRGIPAGSGPVVKPILVGMPPEFSQAVAISDTRAIKDHSWDFTWANPADEGKMKADLENIARKELGLDQPAPAPKPKRTAASVHRKTTPPEPAPLLDEQFRVFELQYDAGATLVFSAHTAGTGAAQKFVTLVAQPDLYGDVVVLLKNTTDGAHLDVNPRMRLVDAVDALDDNRGELLFELRGQTQRQFALYRVLRGQATKIYTSGMSYWGTTAVN
jgi:hypothetical protein